MNVNSFLYKLSSYLEYCHSDFAVDKMTISLVPGGEWTAQVTGSVGNLGDTETKVIAEDDINDWESHQADLGKDMQLEDNYPYF